MKLDARCARLLLLLAILFIPAASWSESPIQALTQRVLGHDADRFRFETLASSAKDRFEVEAKDGKIVVRGATPAVQASGLMAYLKQYCHCDVSWTARQLAIPTDLPKPNGVYTASSPFQYRYYLNFCTFNYTMSFWDWNRWEQEIDWMALNGINLCLAAQIGQEAVWQRTMKRLGQTDDEVRKFLPGPAFGAWWMMGNHQGWGGPDPEWWIDRQVTLQKKILARMRSLGIQPVLAAFYGNVPSSLKNHYPSSRFVSTGNWIGYQRPDMVVPSDPLFDKVSKTFYEEESKLFGKARFYAGDPFHEGSVAEVNLKQAGEAIEGAMQRTSPGSSWVLQAWGNNPQDGMLAGTTASHTLVLDLRGEGGGVWQQRHSFGGRPWILCTIGGFGGKRHFSGWMPEISQGPYRAMGASGFSGIGTVMEGSDLNDALYQMFYDLTYRDKAPDIGDWCAEYSQRRYGGNDRHTEAAWRIFARSVYALPAASAADGEPESVLCARPALQIESASSWGTTIRHYRFADLIDGWRELLQARSLVGSDAYRYDLVDVTRQVLSDWGQICHRRMADAFRAKNAQAFDKESARFLQIIEDMDRLLATRREFLLGSWIESARSLGRSPADKDWLEWNARTQITTWGFGGASESLRDYANKEWSGLLAGFYLKRWSRWIEDRKQELSGRKLGDIRWIDWELAWGKGHEKYPATPSGDPVKAANEIASKYGAEIDEFLLKTN